MDLLTRRGKVTNACLISTNVWDPVASAWISATNACTTVKERPWIAAHVARNPRGL